MGDAEPRLVHAVLDWSPTWFLARLLLVGAYVVGGFTLLAAFVAKSFWTMEGPERFTATNAFFEHVGLVGGFIPAALVAEHARRQGSP